MMEVKNMVLAHGDRVLARDVSFRVHSGECLLLAGSNGCGKTTLLRALAGMGAHGRGWPWVSGCAPIPARTVLIPTGIPKVKGFTLEEFVRSGCYMESDWAGRLSADTQRRMEGALKMLGIDELRGHDISTLSDGEFQKACIAVGLARHADVLLLDEPTAFLDVENRIAVLGTLRELARKTGMAVIFSSHDLHDALAVCNRVLAFTPGGGLLESREDNREEILRAAFPAIA